MRAPLKNAGLIGLFLAIFVMPIVTFPPSASAATYHEWGVGDLESGGIGEGGFTGVDSQRYDVQMNVPAGSNCSTLLASGSNPVVQDEWVIAGEVNDDDGFEMGTVHQCEGFEWWFGAYDYENSSGQAADTPLWNISIAGGAYHNFYLYQYSSGGRLWWQFQVDNTVVGSPVANGWLGSDLNVGTESHSAGVTTLWATDGLAYGFNYGTWTAWPSDHPFTTPLTGATTCAYVAPGYPQYLYSGENEENESCGL